MLNYQYCEHSADTRTVHPVGSLSIAGLCIRGCVGAVGLASVGWDHSVCGAVVVVGDQPVECDALRAECGNGVVCNSWAHHQRVLQHTQVSLRDLRMCALCLVQRYNPENINH